ncbi:MAG: glycosyltransferase family 2 protein [Thermoanaerobaculia bacterium]|nr:MAG: glycosyltransferase family 2 protein [Thermoanaerobaculia bacterium]
MRPRLAVVIPAFNEAGRIAPTLERVLAFLERRGEPFEVVVADDGSTDDTAGAARSFGARGVSVVRLPRNRGKGAAVRAGVAATRAERVLVTDADLSTPIEELPRLESALRDADLAIGSRAVAGATIPVRQPLYRELAGRTFNLLVRLAGVHGVRDTQCGFKLMDGERARSLVGELTVDRFAWDVELIWLARRRGLRVAEVGVEWRNDPASKVRLLRDAARMFADVLRFRRRHRAADRSAR